MTSIQLREKLNDEIREIPDSRLQEIYDVIRFFRLGLEREVPKQPDVMRFAGAWDDLPDFAGFEAELKQRRREALKSRRWQDETSTNKDAGTAQAHDRVVVTHNTAHFGKLPGVKVEDGSSR